MKHRADVIKNICYISSMFIVLKFANNSINCYSHPVRQINGTCKSDKCPLTEYQPVTSFGEQ